MILFHVVGARPNFMKVAPVYRALGAVPGMTQRIVHTGQHYDRNMSAVFFEELGLPEPDINLEVGSGSHAVQTGQVLIRFEEVLLREKPDLVLVYGDINSTVAAAIDCAKLGVPVAHVEAGLRSRDRSMPEEINRLLTDQIADMLFTPSADGDENLLREGVDPSRIFRVGNVMIDTLVRLLPRARRPAIPGLGVRYGLVTLHRPSNVDDPGALEALVGVLDRVAGDVPVVFPLHPRTRARLGVWKPESAGLKVTEPFGYLEFLGLQKDAAFVITDSGGIQEETTYLGVPCLTLRTNTERPITVTEGTNKLVGTDSSSLPREVRAILDGHGKKGRRPDLWDGHAAERIAEVIRRGVGKEPDSDRLSAVGLLSASSPTNPKGLQDP